MPVSNSVHKIRPIQESSGTDGARFQEAIDSGKKSILSVPPRHWPTSVSRLGNSFPSRLLASHHFYITSTHILSPKTDRPHNTFQSGQFRASDQTTQQKKMASSLRSLRPAAATVRRAALLPHRLLTTTPRYSSTKAEPMPSQGELDVGELQGIKFRVAPIKRVGENDDTKRARLLCTLFHPQYYSFFFSNSKNVKG